MDKVNKWFLGLLILLNLLTAVALAVLATSGAFRSSTEQQTIGGLAQLASDIEDGKKVLSQVEQRRLISDFQFVAKARGEVQASSTRLIWSFIQIAAINLVLIGIVFVRAWRNRVVAVAARDT
jgi:hypothetical protein